MIINERGYWENLTGKGHLFDDKLANAILDLLKEKQISSLVDFGCGLADYVKVFKENNIYCKAYDGNPNTETLTGGLGSVLDLSQEIDLNETFDCVLSLHANNFQVLLRFHKLPVHFYQIEFHYFLFSFLENDFHQVLSLIFSDQYFLAYHQIY
jgi:hypothetical protein